MTKEKLGTAGILSLIVMVLSGLSAGAQTANYAYSNANYNGRYSCKLSSAPNIKLCDLAESACVTSSIAGSFADSGTSAAYVVQPNGAGMYTAGEMYLNQADETVCVFTLRTYGAYASSYWVDRAFGIAYETLSWEDYNDDSCWGDYFTDYVEGALVANANSSQPASQTLLTDDNLFNDYEYPGSGNCILGGNVNPEPMD